MKPQFLPLCLAVVLALGTAVWLGRPTVLAARDAGQATIFECSKADFGRCRITLHDLAGEDLKSLNKGDQIQLFFRGKLVYITKSLKVLRSDTYGKGVGTMVVTRGRWMVPVNKQRFAAAGSHEVGFVIVRAGDQVDWEDPALFDTGSEEKDSQASSAQTAHRPKHLRLASMQSNEAAASKPAATSAPVAAPASITIVNNNTPTSNAAAGGVASGNNSGADPYALPRMSLSLRAGTPNSPTGLYGLGLDIYFGHELPVPLFLGYGAYDSSLFMPTSRGRVTYRTASVGTAYVLGHKSAQLRFGADVEHTHVQIQEGTSTQPVGISQSSQGNYLGLVPTIGLHIAADEHAFVMVEAGQYILLNGNYRSDPGSTYSNVSNATDPNHIKNNASTLSLGFGYDF